MARAAHAIVLAAGAGRRMGADKALLDLGGTTAIELVVAAARAGGCSSIVVVRARGAARLPPALAVPRVEVDPGMEMIESVRAGIAARPAGADGLLVFPVDFALAPAAVVAVVLAAMQRHPDRIVLPLHADRPGHPIGFPATLVAEVAAAANLREVIHRDRARVVAVPVESPWVLRDLDTPADLETARAALRDRGRTPAEVMRAHRSHRAYAPTPIAAARIAWLVDTARHAATSSFIQAAAVVVVTDAAKRREIAGLCADQAHVRDAPVFVAICADFHRIAAACRMHASTPEIGTLEAFVQATIDASLFAQNLQLGAEAEGLACCCIGAARSHPRALAALLQLPPHVFVVFGMTLGEAADDPLPRERMPLEGVLHWESYDPAVAGPVLAGMDARMRAWARRTNAERGGYQGKLVSETRGWTERMAQLWGTADGTKSRRNLLEELRALGFLTAEGLS